MIGITWFTLKNNILFSYKSLHGLRHLHSTILISENVDVKTVSARLGHAKTSITLDIYTHAIKARDTVVADTLDNLFSKVQM